MLTRFSGSALIGYKISEWDQTTVPLATVNYKDALKDKDKLVLEGRITRLEYLSPKGKTPLEVFRNHEQALTAAGFTRKYACESGCTDLYFAWTRSVDFAKQEAGMTWSKGRIPAETGSPYDIQGCDHLRRCPRVGGLGQQGGPRGARAGLHLGSAAGRRRAWLSPTSRSSNPRR